MPSLTGCSRLERILTVRSTCVILVPTALYIRVLHRASTPQTHTHAHVSKHQQFVERELKALLSAAPHQNKKKVCAGARKRSQSPPPPLSHHRQPDAVLTLVSSALSCFTAARHGHTRAPTQSREKKESGAPAKQNRKECEDKQGHRGRDGEWERRGCLKLAWHTTRPGSAFQPVNWLAVCGRVRKKCCGTHPGLFSSRSVATHLQSRPTHLLGSNAHDQ